MASRRRRASHPDGPCPGGETGRRKGLKILFPATGVWVRFPPRAPLLKLPEDFVVKADIHAQLKQAKFMSLAASRMFVRRPATRSNIEQAIVDVAKAYRSSDEPVHGARSGQSPSGSGSRRAWTCLLRGSGREIYRFNKTYPYIPVCDMLRTWLGLPHARNSLLPMKRRSISISCASPRRPLSGMCSGRRSCGAMMPVRT